MPDPVYLTIFAITGLITAICLGASRIMRVRYEGKALLIRAKRGDAQPPTIVIARVGPQSRALDRQGQT